MSGERQTCRCGCIPINADGLCATCEDEQPMTTPIDTSTLADPEDFKFWLEDAAQILKSNGTETHAAKVRAAASALESQALTIEGLREALERVRRISLGAEGVTFDLILSVADKALQSLNSSSGGGL